MHAMSGLAASELRAVVASAVDGDELAFARIVDAYDDQMFRVCVVIALDRSLAEDGVQAAWAIAWRKLRTVRDPERLKPWLISIAANETKKLLKKRGRRSEHEAAGDAPERPGGHDPAADIESLDLRAAVERLKPDERELLAMRYIAGFNATELAGVLGISPSGTRNRLERLLARLREELE